MFKYAYRSPIRLFCFLFAISLGCFGLFSAVFAAPPSLIVDKAVDNATPAPGDLVVFSIRYRCASLIDHCYDTVITDSVPNNFNIEGFTLAGGIVSQASASGQTISWELGTGTSPRQLDAGTIGTLNVYARVPACDSTAAQSATTVSNQADMSAFDSSLATQITANSAVNIDIPAIPQCVQNNANPPTDLTKGRIAANGISVNGSQRHRLTFPDHSSSYVVTDDLPAGLIVWSIGRPASVTQLEVECNSSGTFRTINTHLRNSNRSVQLDSFPECAYISHPFMANHDIYNITSIRYTVSANSGVTEADIWVSVFDSNLLTSAQLANWQAPIIGNDIINCISAPALGSGANGQACRTLTIYPEGIWGNMQKNILKSPTSLYAGTRTLDTSANPPQVFGPSDMGYGITIQTVPLGVREWSNPVIVDLLDSYLEYVPYPEGDNWWVAEIHSDAAAILTDPDCLNPSFTAVEDYNGTGRTLLRWEFDGCTIPAEQLSSNAIRNNWINLEFSARIKAGTPANTNITNQGVILVDATTNLIDGSCATGSWPPAETDTLDLDNDGDQSEEICRTPDTSYDVQPISAMSSSKWVQGALDTQYSRFPFNGKTDLTGAGNYELFIENTGNVTVSIVDAVDILPHVGDTGVLPATGNRLSDWGLELAGAIIVEKSSGSGYVDASSDLSIAPQYSASLNPCRFENSTTNNEDLTADQSVANGPSGCTSNPWGAGAAGARSFSFRYEPASGGLAPGESLRITVPVQINGNPPNCDDPNCVGDTADTTAVAWNSFAFGGTYLNAGTPQKLLDTEPIKVGISLVDSSTTAGLGNYVWHDVDGNGFQGGSESPIAGVTVSLYETGSKIDETMTDSNGFYAFYGLTPSGNYSVRLETASDFTSGALQGFSLTQQDGTPTNNLTDSDAALNGDGYPEISATAGTAGTNDMSYDFGFWQPASIGNRIWYDTDSGGDQGITDVGVSNATVTLKQPGVDGTAGTGDDIMVSSQTADSTGYYLFTDLPQGQYFLTFDFSTINGNDPLTGNPVDHNDWVVTLANASGNGLTDSDISASGETILTYLSSGEQDLSWDAGLKPISIPTNPVSLGNYVWEDTTPNDIQDIGEPGIAGVKVELYDISGLPVDVTYTDGTGKYQFDNLEDGDTYSLRFVLPSGLAFIAQDAGSDIIDSDVDPTTGSIGNFVVSPTAASGSSDPDATATLDPRWDAGARGTLSIGNLVWFDLNGDGIVDSGEPRLPGVTVNLLDDSGAPLSPPQTTTTDSEGRYLFTNLAADSYIVEVQTPSGTRSTTDTASSTSPSDGDDNDDNGVDNSNTGFMRSPIISLNYGTGANGELDHGVSISDVVDTTLDRNADYTVDFGFIVRDFGDLLDDDGNNNSTGVGNYNTNDDAAATHTIWDTNGDSVPDVNGAIWLGSSVDGELDGQPNSNPNGNNGDGADEDGVIFNDKNWVANTVSSDRMTITVSTVNNALADVGVWIDWTNDGTFDAFYELENVTAGAHTVPNLSVPASYMPNTPVAYRIRAFTAGTSLSLGTGFRDAAVNGEVEDYQIAFDPTSINLAQVQITDSAGNINIWTLWMVALLLIVITKVIIFTTTRSNSMKKGGQP